MVSILKIRLQTSLQRPLCANGDYLYFYQIYSLQLETSGAYKIVIFRSTSLKLDLLNWKLKIDFKMVSVLKILLQTSVKTLIPRFFRHPVYIFMLAIANQTTRPNWLKFLNGTQGYPWDNKGYKNSIFF